MRRTALVIVLLALIVATAFLLTFRNANREPAVNPSPSESGKDAQPAGAEKPTDRSTNPTTPVPPDADPRPSPAPATTTFADQREVGLSDVPAILGDAAAAVRDLYKKGKLHREWTEEERNSLIALLNGRCNGRWVETMTRACAGLRGTPEAEFIHYLFARLNVKEAETCALDSLEASGGKGTTVLYYLTLHGAAASGERIRDLLESAWNQAGKEAPLSQWDLDRLYAVMIHGNPAVASSYLFELFLRSADTEERRHCLDLLVSTAQPQEMQKLYQALSLEKDEPSRGFMYNGLARMAGSLSEEVDILCSSLAQEQSPALRCALVDLIAKKAPNLSPDFSGEGARVSGSWEDTPYMTGIQFMEMESFLRGRSHALKIQARNVPPMPYAQGWQDRILGPLEGVLMTDPSEEVRVAAVAGLLRIIGSSDGLADEVMARERAVRVLSAAAQSDASQLVRSKAEDGLKKAGQKK